MSDCIITFKGKKYRINTFKDLLKLLKMSNRDDLKDFKNKTVVGEQSILGRLFSKNHMKSEKGYTVDISGETNLPIRDTETGNIIGYETKDRIMTYLKSILDFKRDLSNADEVKLVNNFLKIISKKADKAILIAELKRDDKGFPNKFANEADRRTYQLVTTNQNMKVDTLVYDKTTDEFYSFNKDTKTFDKVNDKAVYSLLEANNLVELSSSNLEDYKERKTYENKLLRMLLDDNEYVSGVFEDSSESKQIFRALQSKSFSDNVTTSLDVDSIDVDLSSVKSNFYGQSREDKIAYLVNRFTSDPDFKTSILRGKDFTQLKGKPIKVTTKDDIPYGEVLYYLINEYDNLDEFISREATFKEFDQESQKTVFKEESSYIHMNNRFSYLDSENSNQKIVFEQGSEQYTDEVNNSFKNASVGKSVIVTNEYNRDLRNKEVRYSLFGQPAVMEDFYKGDLIHINNTDYKVSKVTPLNKDGVDFYELEITGEKGEKSKVHFYRSDTQDYNIFSKTYEQEDLDKIDKFEKKNKSIKFLNSPKNGDKVNYAYAKTPNEIKSKKYNNVIAVDRDVIGSENSVVESSKSKVYVSKELSHVLQGSEENPNMVYLSDFKKNLFSGDVLVTLLSGKSVVLPTNITPEINSILNFVVGYVKGRPNMHLGQTILTENQVALFIVKEEEEDIAPSIYSSLNNVLRVKVIPDSKTVDQELDPFNTNLNNEDVMFFDDIAPSRYQEFNRKVKPPVTDSFAEFRNFKRQVLKETESAIVKLTKDKKDRTKNSDEINKNISKLYLIKSGLENDLAMLEKEEEENLYFVILNTVKYMHNALDNIDRLDLENFKERLDFIFEFVIGLRFDDNKPSSNYNISNSQHPLYGQLVKSIRVLTDKYYNKLDDIAKELLSGDINFFNSVLNNPNLSEEQKKSVLEAKSDINIWDKYFLGTGNSNNYDTAIPQVIKSYMETYNYEEENKAYELKVRMRDAFMKLKDKSFKPFFERTASGALTGNIIDYTSTAFRDELKKFYSFESNPALKSYTQRQNAKLNWLDENTDVIDFRKIKAVKDIYGSVYGNHFKFSDSEMDAYEKELKSRLGKVYDIILDKVFENLEKYNSMITNLDSNLTASQRQEIAMRNDPFVFISNYFEGNSRIIYYNDVTTGEQKSIFPFIGNVTFIPKEKKVKGYHPVTGKEVYEDTGYYSKEFKDNILSNNDAFNFWKEIKEAYTNYINPTYELYGMSFGKFDKSIAELMAGKKNILVKGKVVGGEILNTVKKWFYQNTIDTENEEGVVSNYTDRTKSEIRKLKKVFNSMTDAEVRERAKNLGLKFDSKTDINEIIHDLATEEVLRNYSDDLLLITNALLDQTALQRARTQTAPVADLLLEFYKNIKDEDGKVRTNGIEKLQNFINVVIKNKTIATKERDWEGSKISGKKLVKESFKKAANTPLLKFFFDENTPKMLTKSEKKLYGLLKELYEKGYNKEREYSFVLDGVRFQRLKINGNWETTAIQGDTEVVVTEEVFEKAFKKDIENQLDNLGLDLTGAGIISGVMKTMIASSMAFSPVGGVRNRTEGHLTNMLNDETGEYWTPGNYLKADRFLAFANTIKTVTKFGKISPLANKKFTEIHKAMLLFERLNIIQDRKDVLEKNVGDTNYGLNHLEDLVYAWSITLPEFKTQGGAVLSVLGDMKILNKETGEMEPVFNLDKQEFSIYDLKDGKLVLKEPYRTEENIRNWEDFKVDRVNLANNSMFVAKSQAQMAVSSTQGNYEKLDTVLLSKNSVTKSLLLFKRWFANHAQQRFASGEGINTITGKQNMRGRYRHVFDNPSALIPATAIQTGLSLGLGAVGATVIGGSLAGLTLWSLYKNFKNKENTKQRLLSVSQMASFARSVIINTVNLPTEFLLNRRLLKREWDGFVPQGTLTPEQIGGIRATAKEIAVQLSFIYIGMTISKLIGEWTDDDDDDEANFRNYIMNEINNTVNNYRIFQDPLLFVDEQTKLPVLRYFGNVIKMMKSFYNWEFGKGLETFFTQLSPAPRTISKYITEGAVPFLQKDVYDKKPWYIKSPMFMTAEKAAYKEIYAARKEYRAALKEQLQETNPGWTEEKLKYAVNKKMTEVFGKISKSDKREDKYQRALKGYQDKGLM